MLVVTRLVHYRTVQAWLNMKTNSQALLWTLITCALILATQSTFPLGCDYPSGKLAAAGSLGWPKGMDKLVNATNRVHGYWINAEDVFFFSGDAAQFTAFLRDCAQLDEAKNCRLILHEGVGEAKSPWGKVGRPCDWKLYVCPKGWRNAAILLEQHTNPVEVIQKAAREPGYVLEVHLWTGGRIAPDQVHIPKNVEVAKEK
jgi:hypothetical protein